MNILVTGGAGFIGSHTVVELVEAGHTPFIIDNFTNSDSSVIDRLEKIVGKPMQFLNSDVRDARKLSGFIENNNIDGVIHFAALKAVGESVEKPLDYYRNNLDGLLSVLEVMTTHNINNLIFSSSATVYGVPDTLPITEDAALKTPTNPYGATKQMSEQIIKDVAKTSKLRATLLRYFNPIGAHTSNLIGESPLGTPNNLVPIVVQAASGKLKEIVIAGDDYDTPDGTGVRDYIHVVDLAKAHVKALEKMNANGNKLDVYNLGTGKGSSVLEVIEAFEKVNNVKVPHRIGPRRDGDIATVYASAEKAEAELGWKASLTLEDALRDSWNFAKQSPQEQDS